MRRRGFALALVLFALLLLSALAAAALFAALQESRIGRGAAGSLRASWTAQRAVVRAVAAWDPAAYDSLTPGAALRLDPGSDSLIDVEVRRLSAELFLVRALGRDMGSGAERQSALIVRADVPWMGAAAAVRARSVAADVTSFVSGADVAPDGWTCGGAGAPAVAVDLQPAATDSQLFSFGSWSWERLVDWAAGISGSGAGDSITVVLAPAALTLTGGRFLGLLVVDGDLVLRGGAQIVGMALVKGRLVFDGAGGRVVGGVVAGSLELGPGALPGSGAVAFSRCAEEAALLARAPVQPLPKRALADLPEGIPFR